MCISLILSHSYNMGADLETSSCGILNKVIMMSSGALFIWLCRDTGIGKVMWTVSYSDIYIHILLSELRLYLTMA